MNLKLSIDRAVDEGADRVDVADPGPKPDDRGGERAARHRALAGLGSALAVEADVRAASLAAAARRAEVAVWLGASLADLGGVTGHSRQAARKRWPDLGAIHRRRHWLGYHVDDVFWAVRLVLDADLEGIDPQARAALADALAVAERDFAPDADVDPRDLDAAVARWEAFDALVDRHLRAVVAAAPAEPVDPGAGFAVHGARGVLRYYDHAVGEPVES
ncbi:hypothetical protein Acsp06_46490 [Actinomycetospora sp. NBRC 106375]|uniref:hypothetical protein n=1 Tax=Actinomycetospora sp. NBRC 106375 TaxID=3032207 RepID=UPI0024A1B2E1|nr:hypothetical protein [Actinomycetospora sp. NBRC 106375]GLZ48464.1 hypothetical protein Acsp06_46490 [Actinomycetospora sp. NBRC 106375]